jgi:hypothetical protein
MPKASPLPANMMPKCPEAEMAVPVGAEGEAAVPVGNEEGEAAEPVDNGDGMPSVQFRMPGAK